MDHRTLGNTGVHVSPLCLGAMMFGAWGETDHDESIRIIHRALDAGINFVDTADVYSRGESEEIVGKALKADGRRDNVVLATKFHGSMGDDPNEAGNSRRWIMREVEASLKRLQTDWIDLYQVHRWDPWTDHDETLGALSDLVAQGKVRYIGSSTYPAAQIVKAQWVAEKKNLQRFVCEQPPYSILARGIENDVLPTCLEYGMGVIPWSPLAGGWLSGKWRKGADDLTSRRSAMLPQRYDLSIPENQAKLDAADALGQLADDSGISLIHLALAFVIKPPGGHGGDHRPAHDGAARVPARGGGHPARRRDPRPHRRDRRRPAPRSTPPTPAGPTRLWRRRRAVASACPAARRPRADRARPSNGAVMRPSAHFHGIVHPTLNGEEKPCAFREPSRPYASRLGGRAHPALTAAPRCLEGPA